MSLSRPETGRQYVTRSGCSDPPPRWDALGAGGADRVEACRSAASQFHAGELSSGGSRRVCLQTKVLPSYIVPCSPQRASVPTREHAALVLGQLRPLKITLLRRSLHIRSHLDSLSRGGRQEEAAIWPAQNMPVSAQHDASLSPLQDSKLTQHAAAAGAACTPRPSPTCAPLASCCSRGCSGATTM